MHKCSKKSAETNSMDFGFAFHRACILIFGIISTDNRHAPTFFDGAAQFHPVIKINVTGVYLFLAKFYKNQ